MRVPTVFRDTGRPKPHEHWPYGPINPENAYELRNAGAGDGGGRPRVVPPRRRCAGLEPVPHAGRACARPPTGRLVIDAKKIKAEERPDGKYLLSTSDPDLSAEDVALGYKNLLEAERGFRDMKSTLQLRPVFHRLEHRIRAHVVICWLELLLIRVAERQTGQTWRRIALELQCLTLTGPDGTVQQTTPPSPLSTQTLAAMKTTAPPRIAAIQPA
jgi:hypothetical protein